MILQSIITHANYGMINITMINIATNR